MTLFLFSWCYIYNINAIATASLVGALGAVLIYSVMEYVNMLLRGLSG
jgi:hypothetical protein